MDQQLVALFATVALASAVEMVEAATIVLAMGSVRGWRSALAGTFSALITLGLIVLLAGPSILLVPIELLRIIVGALLLIFGLQWLRKAILRASSFKALHDEELIFASELDQAKKAKHTKMFGDIDKYSFTLTFKTVLLEGFEVVFIVLTFGALKNSIGTATIAALVALLVVAASAFVIRKPLARVPENTLKFIVGIMATTFGIFWSTEGLGLSWPLADLALIGIAAWVAAVSYICVRWLKRVKSTDQSASLIAFSKRKAGNSTKLVKISRPIIEFLKDFVIADEWLTALALWFIVLFGSIWVLPSFLWPLLLCFFSVALPVGLARSIARRQV